MQKILTLATCLALSLAAKDKLVQLINLSAPGASSPNEIYNFTKNETHNFKEPNKLTNLGITQQFLIGSELRQRYIIDEQFLNSSYNVDYALVQSVFDDASILSAQAQLVGLYPPESNAYWVNSNQKYNAVPPIEGYDFTKFIDELETEGALQGSYSPFAINMIGSDDDIMLTRNDKSCPNYHRLSNKLRNCPEFQKRCAKYTDTLYPKLSKCTGQNITEFHHAANVCQYALAAHSQGIELRLNFTEHEECEELLQNQLYYEAIGNDDLWKYSASSFMKYLGEQILVSTGDMSIFETETF